LLGRTFGLIYKKFGTEIWVELGGKQQAPCGPQQTKKTGKSKWGLKKNKNFNKNV